jgi:hypothetical protein
MVDHVNHLCMIIMRSLLVDTINFLYYQLLFPDEPERFPAAIRDMKQVGTGG